MQKARDINFFARHRENQMRNNKTAEKWALKIGLLTLVILGIGVPTGTYAFKAHGLQEEINAIDAFLQSPEVLNKFEVVRVKKQQLDYFNRYNMAIDSAAYRIVSQPELDREVLDDIESRLSQDIIIYSMSYSGGEVEIECTASDHNEIANFVHKLRKSRYIHDVLYTGYTKDDTNKEVSTSTTTRPTPATTTESRPVLGENLIDFYDGPESRGYTASMQIILTPGGEE